MITKDQWSDWKRNPVTQQFLKDLLQNRMGRMEDVADGKVEGNELYLEIGRIQGIKDAVEYAVTKFQYMEIDSGPESGGVSSNSEG